MIIFIRNRTTSVGFIIIFRDNRAQMNNRYRNCRVIQWKICKRIVIKRLQSSLNIFLRYLNDAVERTEMGTPKSFIAISYYN